MVPASSLVMAVRVCVRRLKRVDLPTLGRPTIAINCDIFRVDDYCGLAKKQVITREGSMRFECKGTKFA